MFRRILHAIGVALVTTAIAVPAGFAGADLSDPSSIWVVDDFTKRTYNLTPEGALNFFFDTPNTGVSSIDVDHRDGTLWGANDQSNKIVHYTYEFQAGAYTAIVLQQIFLDSIGSVGSEGVAVALSHEDDSLWIVDDPSSTDQAVPTVYNITREGQLISSFRTAHFDSAALSPQAIAFDPFDQTLWISDNVAATVYNVTQDGRLMRKFRTDLGPFLTADNPTGVGNVQGIGVESEDVLWLTARDTGKIYQITKSGDRVLRSFPSASFDASSANPVGVAYGHALGVGVGVASDFALLGLSGSKIKLKDEGTGVVGDVGLAADAEQDFDRGLLTGSLVIDPDADGNDDHDVVISGDTVVENLVAAERDALRTAVAAAALPATKTFGEIKSTTTIAGNTGRTVVRAEKIELDQGETLTLSGGPSSEFVINIDEKLKLKDASAVVLVGGVQAENVLFNVAGDEDSAITDGSVAYGTILAPAAGKVSVKGSLVVGRIIAGGEILLEDWGRIRMPASANAAGDLGEAGSAGVLALPGSKLKLRDAGSTVVRDALLGPMAKQEFTSGRITGSLLVDPAADNTRESEVVIEDGTIRADLSQAVADAIDAAYVAAGSPPDQRLDEVKSTTSITGGPGLNTILLEKIELDDGEVLTLVGDASAVFVINVRQSIKLKGGSEIVVAGGVSPDNVLLNTLSGSESVVEGGSSVHGTVLAVFADKLKVKEDGSLVMGGIIGGGEVVVEEGAVVGR